MGWSSAPVIEAGTVDITAGTVEVENVPGSQLATYGQAQLVYTGTLAGLNGLTVPATPLAAGARSLMVVLTGSNLASALTLTGASGAVYVELAAGNLTGGGLPAFAPFDSTVDDQVTATSAGGGNVAIYAIADLVTPGSYPRGTTAGIAQNVVVMGGQAGSVGIIPLRVDSQGRLELALQTIEVIGSTGAAFDGAPGSAPPANALQIAGTDGTDLRALAVASDGAVTADQGDPNTAANAWPVEVTDGTNVLGTSAHPLRNDPTGTTTQPVSGTVTADQGTIPWETQDQAVSGLKAATVNSTGLAAGGTASIVAASAGKTVTVYGVLGSLAPGAATVGTYAAFIESATTAVQFASARLRAMTTVGFGSAPFGPLWFPGGFPLPVGEGAQVLAAAGNSAVADTIVTLLYTQA